MSDQKHTPGPWDDVTAGWDIINGHRHYTIRVESADTGVAIVILPAEDRTAKTAAERHATARLIAAAPDLLDVAHLVLSTATVETPPELVAAAEAAIRKAEGGES